MPDENIPEESDGSSCREIREPFNGPQLDPYENECNLPTFDRNGMIYVPGGQNLFGIEVVDPASLNTV
jgi:hypothetical protein